MSFFCLGIQKKMMLFGLCLFCLWQHEVIIIIIIMRLIHI